MEKLSFTQRYFLCAINNQRTLISSLNETFPCCLISGGIVELVDHRYITRVKKDNFIVKNININDLLYLKPLYETISLFNRKNKTKFFTDIHTSKIRTQLFYDLYFSFGESLVKLEYVKPAKKHGFPKEINYIPRPESWNLLIDELQQEIYNPQKISKETLCLIALLDASGLAHRYFNKMEINIIKKHFKKVAKSESYVLLREILCHGEKTML